ncbi:MAG: hypothetical protein II652_00450 [Bacteroidales bacterium]|nr:hypothetical protein [Bacteroidales bacterium]
MRTRKLFTKKKGKDGEGRQANIKHLLLPEEVVEELKLYKDAYSVCLSREKDEWGNPIPVRVSWEQMFRRWMDQVGRFDRDVKDYVDEGKKYRAENPPTHTYPVDPTEGAIWEMEYVFERDGEELEAHLGDMSPFFAVVNGHNVGFKQMLADGWTLMNDAGVEIDDIEVARKINRIIREHQASGSPVKGE